MKALILDDDAIVISLVSAMLKSKGYEVTSCGSEEELSNISPELLSSFNLALVDLQLGNSSGISIYNDRLSPHLKIENSIFMSANSIQDAVDLYGLPLEANYLEKPFKAPDLYRLINP